MKKVLMILISMSLFIGCSRDKSRLGEAFINQLLNCSTYTDEELGEDQLPKIFKNYFSKEGYEGLKESQMGLIYAEFFETFEAKETQDLSVKEIIKIEQKNSTKIKYGVRYIVLGANKTTKMKDEVLMIIDEQDKIAQMYILNTSDVIKKLFLDTKIM